MTPAPRSLVLTLAALGALHPLAARADCAQWNPLDYQTANQSSGVSARDMIQLANFGRPDGEPMGEASPLALSPDGRQVAFVLQRADLDDNRYCQALVVVDVGGRTPPRVLDRGGNFIMVGFVFRKIYAPIGAPRLNTPAWSSDGGSIAYLRRDEESTQLWRARLDGSAPVQITHVPAGIDAWSWALDGRSLLYAASPARLDAEQSVAREGLGGWHYDERFEPNSGIRPQPPAPQASVATALDPDTRVLRTLTPADEKQLAKDRGEEFTAPRVDTNGDKAWLEQVAPSPVAPWRLAVARRNGTRIDCGTVCESGVFAMWWGSGRSLTFIRREGWNKRFTAIYRWAPDRSQPILVLRTDDLIQGCRPAGPTLVCVRESVGVPPRLVSLDRRSGVEHILFDPNPGFRSSTLGSVTRLEWRNAIGREVYGDLVLPPGRRDGPFPTIVVQYRSRGFLRGGVGNEYPIYLFAQRGFAVLSIEAPALVAATDPAVRTADDVGRANTKGWAERHNTLSAVESGLDLLVSRGIADPKRLGITGLSDGASTARFALINTKRFAAAAISTCCVDESSDILVGPAWAAFSEQIGYPPAYPVEGAFWRPYSFVLNAESMSTPLLMQLADSETLYGLPSVTALATYRQPVDLYVFPDEFHIKWQPQHRRAIFERNLAWFSFWLQGHEDNYPGNAAQFARWRELRAAKPRDKSASPSIGP